MTLNYTPTGPTRTATTPVEATTATLLTTPVTTLFTTPTTTPATTPANIKLGIAIAMAFAAIALSLASFNVSAEVTQDCILEGTVDMRKAQALGQNVYVNFRNAKRGSEAVCSMSRPSKSRRVKFISSPDTSSVENVSHGSKVRYRYIEHDNEQGSWERMDLSDSRSS